MTEMAAGTEKYIDIMIESLRKKDRILKQLLDRCEDQAKVIADHDYGSVNWDQFNGLIADKEILINQLEDLDNGFEALFERIGDEVRNNKERYSTQIRTIQELIRSVTDKGVAIRAREERNRANLERVLLPAKKEIKSSKRSMSVINSYQNTMSGAGLHNSSGWVDKKK
ncbi:MAG: hypothetical protein K6G83_00765 [Lachnospiraceae bacterium]|nr:hypothetical protein [Lachnospiraceae bacterium]